MLGGWIFVSPDGDDASGTELPASSRELAQSKPLRTVQAAIRIARPGSVILLREGIYVENIRVDARSGHHEDGESALRALTERAPLRLVGADGLTLDGVPKARIVGAELRSTVQVVEISHVHLHNLEIQGRDGLSEAHDEAPVKIVGGDGGTPPEVAAGGIELHCCRISGHGSDAVKVAKGNRIRVVGCVIDVNTPGSMIDFVSVLDSEVLDCEFLGRAREGTSAKGASARILWNGNIYRYSGNYCCAVGWKDAAITMGGIGWSRTNRDMPEPQWNVECFDSIARRNLFAGAYEHAVTLQGAHDCLVEANFVGHLGAPGRLPRRLYAWRAEEAPSYPWRNQWLPYSDGSAEQTWPSVRAQHAPRLDRLGFAVNAGNVIRGNTLRAGGGYRPGFSRNDEDPMSPNVISDEREGVEAEWLAAVGSIGPKQRDATSIYEEIGLQR